MNEERNNVLIVSSQPAVSKWMYSVFDKRKILSQNYYIENVASTRESAFKIATETSPGIIFFFEKTAGVMTISETLYKLRLTGARVIYISDQRIVGDYVLEAVVGYGVYDIILQQEISEEDIENMILYPREFKDVAILHRMVEIVDNNTGNKRFKIPDLDMLRSFSNRLDEDYLTDSSEKIVANFSNQIDKEEDTREISGFLFKNKKEKKQPRAVPRPQPTPSKNKTSNSSSGLGDIDFDL